jgi:hypothetical protein
MRIGLTFAVAAIALLVTPITANAAVIDSFTQTLFAENNPELRLDQGDVVSNSDTVTIKGVNADRTAKFELKQGSGLAINNNTFIDGGQFFYATDGPTPDGQIGVSSVFYDLDSPIDLSSKPFFANDIMSASNQGGTYTVTLTFGSAGTSISREDSFTETDVGTSLGFDFTGQSLNAVDSIMFEITASDTAGDAALRPIVASASAPGAAIPLPATLWMLIAGIGCIGLLQVIIRSSREEIFS